MTKPLFIWTFRRTGGTNLASFLFDNSKQASLEHEPFNLDRIYGDLLKQWNASNDSLRELILYKQLKDILREKVNIKHCIEMVPSRFNDILSKVLLEEGYEQLFLFRSQVENRLLSLNYAQKTLIWGKDQVEGRDNIDFNCPMPVEELIDHEVQCQVEMRRVFNSFLAKEYYPLSISFEMLYNNEIQVGSHYLMDILKAIGVSRKDVDLKSIECVLSRGAQGTKDDYLKFPRAEELLDKVEELTNFRLNIFNSQYPEYIVQSDRLQYFDVWEKLPSIHYGYYHLQGVCLLKEDYSSNSVVFKTEDTGEEVGILKLPSNRINELFPENSMSAQARFFTHYVYNSIINVNSSNDGLKLAVIH